MRKLLPILFLLCSIDLSAQQLPLYTQYVFNPYMLNPSMVASTGRPELNLLYRQQWSNITDGPKTLQFDGQYRLNDKMGLGIMVNQDQTVLLSSTMAMLTYGYRIRLAQAHTIGFGLSAGMFQNRIRSEDAAPVDQNDPALMSAVSNNIAVDGQFGIHYRTGGFLFAYSLVNLFDRKPISTESFQTPKFSQLKNQVLLASYRFSVIPSTLYLQPNVAYRMTDNDLSYLEGSLIASIKNVVDVGGGFRQDFGPTAMVRVSVGPIQAGFAYDFPSNTGLVSPGGTKEIQLKWRFGKAEVEEPRGPKKSRRQEVVTVDTTRALPPVEDIKPKQEEKPVVEEKKEEPPVVTQPEPVKQEPIVVQPEPVKEEPLVVQPEVKPEVKPAVVEEKKPEPPKVMYYYIIETFQDAQNADKFMKSAKAKGIKVEMFESQNPHYYYIHLPEYKTSEISVEKVLELQKKTGFKDGWFKKME